MLGSGQFLGKSKGISEHDLGGGAYQVSFGGVVQGVSQGGGVCLGFRWCLTSPVHRAVQHVLFILSLALQDLTRCRIQLSKVSLTG